MFLFFVIVCLLTLTNCFACPLTDEYLSRCHCGILTNGDSYIQCNEYSLTAMPIFKRSFPYDELRLTKNFIRILTSSSFDNIKTIKRIYLEENSLEQIDADLFRLLGNYLEELTLTGNGRISSVEFLTRYPLKKLRFLKLDRFDLSDVDLNKIFVNMTKLEKLTLRSCQLTEIPQLNRLTTIEIEENPLAKTIFLSTNYSRISLISNRISSIILQQNPFLTFLNLSMNELKEFYSIGKYNSKLNVLDLSKNQLTNVDSTIFTENLIDLNLSSNRIRTIDRSLNVRQLNRFDLSSNPLDCNCHLKWLKDLQWMNTTHWNCATPFVSSFLSADFKCQSFSMARLINWNVTFVQLTTDLIALALQWKIVDPYQTIRYLQISFESPYRLSERISSNRTFLFLKNDLIQSHRRYHLCLILVQQYSRDRYCREIFTHHPTRSTIDFNSIRDEDFLIFIDDQSSTTTTTTNKSSSWWFDITEHHFRLMLIGSCLGGLITMILLFTCCYLCYQLHHFRRLQTSTRISSHPTYHLCPHRIYHSENLSSNSTDSTQIDSLLSTSITTNPTKHIYQTIDNHDYSTLTRNDKHLFDLWNESIREQC